MADDNSASAPAADNFTSTANDVKADFHHTVAASQHAQDVTIVESISDAKTDRSTQSFDKDPNVLVTSTTATSSQAAPLDRGLAAWLQVVAGFFVFMNTWGLVSAFGEFETFYSTHLLLGTSSSTIAWIGTLTSFLLCASPITWGPVFDLYGNARLLVCGGSVAVALGIMLTSICDEYWQLICAQGVIVGIGGGALFLTATSILPAYFVKKRALAMGLAASGSSFGGIIYPIIFHQLQPRIGFGWAVRVIGFIVIATLAVPCALLRSRNKPSGKRRKIFDTAILRDLVFETFNTATFTGFVGQYIPFFYVELYAREHGLGLTFWMLIFLNLGSMPGRIFPGLIADRWIHPVLVLNFCTAIASILAFCWIGIQDSTAGLAVWCCLYGFFSGAFVSLQPPAVASMAPDLSTIGTRFGINLFFGAFGILIGSPVSGAISAVSWPGAQAFCGATLAVSSSCMAATYVVFRRRSRSSKT